MYKKEKIIKKLTLFSDLYVPPICYLNMKKMLHTEDRFLISMNEELELLENPAIDTGQRAI